MDKNILEKFIELRPNDIKDPIIKLSTNTKYKYRYLKPGWMFNSDDEYVTANKLSKSLKSIGLNLEYYYNIVILKINSYDEVPRCKLHDCNKLVEFKNLQSGYNTYCSQRCKGYDMPIESRNSISIKLIGTKQSESTKLLRSDSLKGGKIHNDEFRTNMSLRFKGVPKSDESKRKISESLIKYYSNPDVISECSIRMIKYIKEHPDHLDKFIKSSVCNTKRGYYKPNKSDKSIFYMSSWELDLMRLCDKFEFIKSISTSPRIDYVYKGVNKIYIPDLLLEYCNGLKLIIEVKPVRFINDPKVLAKKFYSEEFCRLNNYKYIILTQNEIYSDNLESILSNQ